MYNRPVKYVWEIEAENCNIPSGRYGDWDGYKWRDTAEMYSDSCPTWDKDTCTWYQLIWLKRGSISLRDISRYVR